MACELKMNDWKEMCLIRLMWSVVKGVAPVR